jgi:hypothetical protein
MNINYRQRRQLRRIKAGLRRSDPHLSAMLDIFGRLYRDEAMPGEEEEQPSVPATRSRILQ